MPPDAAVPSEVVGLLLAAGAGRRAGGPKALRTDDDGTSWLLRSIAVLRDGGCSAVAVVLGCAADRAREIIAAAGLDQDPDILVVEAPDWDQGMGLSLRAGILAVGSGTWRAALVHLVDLPDVSAAVVRRVITRASTGTDVLARATYHQQPGHPVLIGSDHLQAIVADLTADRGARDYLARRGAIMIECGDLAGGHDRDM